MNEDRTTYPRYVKLTEAGLKKLADAMKRNKVTVEWLAGETGIAVNSLRKYKRGGRTFVSKIEKVFEALNLTLTEGVDCEYDTEEVRITHDETLTLEDTPSLLKEIPQPYKTLVFTDIEKSTTRWDAEGNPFLQYILLHHALLRRLASWYDGEEVNDAGDGFFFAFDKAEKAVRFAIAVQQDLPNQVWQNDLAPTPLCVRIGMRTGRALYLNQDGEYYGHAANEAARIMGVTPPGCIFVCNATRDDAWAARRGSYEFDNLGIHHTKEGIELWLYQVKYEGYMPANPIETTQTAQKSLVRVENVPYARNEYFTGREDILQTLASTIETGTPLAITQAIHGLGGIGKTQTAVEYFYRYGERYSAVLWCRADTTDALTAGYVELARTLKLPEANLKEQPKIVEAVVQWLGEPANSGYLLILDNADDPNILTDFLPRFPKKLQGHVLLTSRKDRFKALIKPVLMPRMTTEEATDYLFARVGRDRDANPGEEVKANELAEEFGGLPLALEQAAAYIYEKRRTFAVYLHEYRTRRGEIRSVMNAPEMGEHRRFDRKTNEYKEHLTVWTTWDLNFEDVEKNAPGSAELLKLSAFLAPDAIPMELVAAALPDAFADAECDEDKERIFLDLLLPLTATSLATVAEKTFSVHRMVQTVLQDRMTLEECTEAQKATLRLLNVVTPDPQEIENWPLLERVRPHVQSCFLWIKTDAIETQDAAGLLNLMARYLHDIAAYTEAKPLYVRALAIRKKVLGRKHPDTVESLNNLAEMYRVQGRYKRAEPLLVRALAIREQDPGPEHTDTGTSLNNLALLYRELGRYEAAERLQVRALAIWEQAQGPEQPLTALGLNNLGELYFIQGRYEEAESLFVRALAIREAVLKPKNPSTALSLNNLATLYRKQRRYEEAEPLSVRALAIRENVLGPEHPHTAQSLHTLAELYRAQGKYEEAEPLYARALAILQKAWGSDNPYTKIVAEHYSICKKAIEGQR